MGLVKKIGNEYYIEFEARGLKYQQKAGTDEAVARRLLEDVEGKIKKGEMGAIIRDADIDIFFKDFIEYARAQHTPKTNKRFQTLIIHFQDFLRSKEPQAVKLSQITPIVLDRYKMFLDQKTKIPVRKGNRAKAINLSFFLLYETFQFAIKQGYLNDNPTLHIRRMDFLPPARPCGLTENQVSTVLKAAGPLRDILEFMLLTGARWREVTAINWADVDQAHGLVRVGNRAIPLTPRTREIITGLDPQEKAGTKALFADPAGRPLNTQALCLQFQELLYNCGLKNHRTVSCLRESFAISLLNKGMSAGSLYKYLGLPDIAGILIYAPFIPEKRKELYSS